MIIKHRKISEISYHLKQMANEIKTLVICTVQVPDYKDKPTLAV